MSGSKENYAEYVGQWKAGKRHGHGKITWADGTNFKGEWVNDERKKGKQTLNDGNVS
jgi:hypothetical protein